MYIIKKLLKNMYSTSLFLRLIRTVPAPNWAWAELLHKLLTYDREGMHLI